MTTVHVDLRHPDGDTIDAPSVGYLVWTPSIRIHVDEADDYIRVPQPFTAKLVVGKVDVDVPPTEPAWYWRVRENVPRGIVRYVLVPDQAEVEYGDLVDIDPDSYDPVQPGIPGWVPAIEDLQEQIDNIEASDVESVNGQTGVVVLDAGDVGAATPTQVVDAVAAEALIRNNDDADLQTQIDAIVGGETNQAKAVSTDASFGLPAPTGTGFEFVITANSLEDIQFDGVNL